jgi:hypothetical protein
MNQHHTGRPADSEHDPSSDGHDPVADDITSRNPDSDDVVAGEQVLDEGKVAPDQDAGETRPHNARPEEPAEGA